MFMCYIGGLVFVFFLMLLGYDKIRDLVDETEKKYDKIISALARMNSKS